MGITYGLSTTGFRAKQQQEIIAELSESLQATFGSNINLAPESNFGQLVNILSERETLIWQLAEAVYTSQYPSGAEGTSVDNILALNGMRRLPAIATRTASATLVSSNGITLYPLLLFGTPGAVIPAGSIIQNTASPPLSFKTDTAATIQAAVDALQSLFFSNTPASGAFQLSLNSILTPSMPYNILAQSSKMVFASVPSMGYFSLGLTVGGVTVNTPSIIGTASAIQVQAAIQSVSGYGAVTVTGSMAAGFQINWGSIANPILSVNSNTTGIAIAFQDSLQALMNALTPDSIVYPYVGIIVTVGASGFNFAFAGVSGAKPQPLIVVAANSLVDGLMVTNISVVSNTNGAAAQASVAATCTATGPNFVAAGALSVIGSALTGWSGVTNQLDCITGADVETDTAAMLRRAANLQAQANGPLASIIEKVRAVSNVVTAIGFENLNEAALQVVTFPILPVSGKYNLLLNGIASADIQWNSTAAQIQTIMRAISGFSEMLVTGSLISGFTFDFNGSLGGQPIDQMNVVGNTTGGAIVVGFGRPGKSFEVVVDGGADGDIASTILKSKPAGIQTYGSTYVTEFDAYGNGYHIGFSRPTTIPIYISIVLQTDYFTANTPKFNPNSVATIQQDLVAIGNAFGIGGLVIGRGTNGLIGAFNDVPGILSYTLFFDRLPNPTTDTNIQMQLEEVPVFETFNISVSYT